MHDAPLTQTADARRGGRAVPGRNARCEVLSGLMRRARTRLAAAIACAVLAACGGSTSSSGAFDAGTGANGGVGASGGAPATGGLGGGGGFPTAGGAPGTGGLGGGGTPDAGGAPGGGGGSGSCVVPKPGELDGDYFLTLSMKLAPSKPFVFAVNVTTEAFVGQVGMRWTIRNLLWSDRKTPVGDPIAPTPPPMAPFLIDALGTVHVQLDAFAVLGEANPLTHTPVMFDATLEGAVCGGGGFFCGTFGGYITKPIPVDLTGSTWTLQKVSGAVFPEPPAIDCAKNLAAPVATLK